MSELFGSSASRPSSHLVDKDSVDEHTNVAAMKAEIVDVQGKTTASLDRAIATAQAASSTGVHITEELHDQREQMGRIDADVNDTADTLRHTAYQLKYGFTWRGALTAPFRRGSKKPATRGAARSLSPVFTEDAIPAPAHEGKHKKETTRSPRRFLGRQSPPERDAGKCKDTGSVRGPSAGHVPDGFDNQLDTLEGLVDGLAAQATAIGTELKQQNKGIDVLAGNLEPVRAETSSQASKIKRRFGVR